MDINERPLWLGIRRGLARRCPACGHGHLFCGFLKVTAHCDTCGADSTIYPSDDFPPYLTILVTGHLVVPLLFFTDRTLNLAPWLECGIFVPLTAALCLLLLPVMKGATVGLCWATGMVRSSVATN